jgi:hypothetical protein
MTIFVNWHSKGISLQDAKINKFSAITGNKFSYAQSNEVFSGDMCAVRGMHG